MTLGSSGINKCDSLNLYNGFDDDECEYLNRGLISVCLIRSYKNL